MHTKKVRNTNITKVEASNFVFQYLSRQHIGDRWRGNGIKTKSTRAFQLAAFLNLDNFPFKLNQNTKEVC